MIFGIYNMPYKDKHVHSQARRLQILRPSGTLGLVGSVVSIAEVSVTPNPAVDAITVSNAIGSYSIKNMLGQVMLEGSIDAAQPKVNVSNLAKGNYIISLGINGMQPINKIFVKD